MNSGPPSPTPDDPPLSGLGRALLGGGSASGFSATLPARGPWLPPTAEELQKLLPQYEITSMLGRGGMGAVYQGRQKSLDRAVAIKILFGALEGSDIGFKERFKNEARAMAKLSHPGIVAVHDFGETADGMLYIVMEYVEGTDVARMIASQGRLHTEHAMAITAYVCDALAYAHERGIIHRDIKPANIMVSYDGVVKVADFGLAKVHDGIGETLGLTQSGMVMGTLQYMAPEALTLGSAVDHRADIYAVGVMLYQMLTGKVPHGMFELPSIQVAGLDPRYDGIVAKAMREDREVRYQKVEGLRADLDSILTQPVVKVEEAPEGTRATLPTRARPQRPGPRPPQRAPRSSPPTPPLARKSAGAWVAWAALGAVAISIGGYVWWHRTAGGSSAPGQRGEEAPHAMAGTATSGANPIPGALIPLAATKDTPWVNSLGMKFVPVRISGGATDGKTLLFSVWETRVQDFAAFAAEDPTIGSAWKNLIDSGVAQEATHPVVNVTWDDAVKFCEWLGKRENHRYRLPSDHEWSCAAGLADEDPAQSPAAKGPLNPGAYPWGASDKPPAAFANYRYTLTDDFPFTAPVGSFPPSAAGLHDLWGNANEWCTDWHDSSRSQRVIRGHSWGNWGSIRTMNRRLKVPEHTEGTQIGFRCVVEAPVEAAAGTADTPPARSAVKDAAAGESAGWLPLFPDGTLAGWEGNRALYSLADGILTSTGRADLISSKSYGSFRLKFDLRLAAEANSGIGIWRNGGTDAASRGGFEVQIQDDTFAKYKSRPSWERHGGIFFFQAPEKLVMGPVGSWNTHEIKVEGTDVTVTINGSQVLRADLAQLRPLVPQAAPLDLTRKRGRLALMGRVGRSEFRNLMIQELD